MKKHFSIAAVVLAAAAALFLSACGKTDSGKQKIGISIPSADHGWTGGVVFWAKQAKQDIEAAHPDIEVLISAAADSASQVNGIENLLIRGIDALVVLPHEPAPLTGICEKVAQSGKKLIVVDRGLARPVEDLAVVGDNPGMGRAAAEVIAAELGGRGNIVLMQGVLCQVNTERVEAFKAVIARYPGLKILDDGVSDWKTEQGLRLMENYLQKYPVIDAVWTGDDDVLLGALKAYEESKRKDVKLFIGGGGSKAIIRKILDKDPLVRQTVTYPPRMIYSAAEEAVKLLKGSVPADKRMVIKAEVVDRSNAAANYYPDSAY